MVVRTAVRFFILMVGMLGDIDNLWGLGHCS